MNWQLRISDREEVVEIALRQAEEVRDAIVRAAAANAVVIHTLVDPELREVLKDAAATSGV